MAYGTNKKNKPSKKMSAWESYKKLSPVEKVMNAPGYLASGTGLALIKLADKGARKINEIRGDYERGAKMRMDSIAKSKKPMVAPKAMAPAKKSTAPAPSMKPSPVAKKAAPVVKKAAPVVKKAKK